MSWDHRLTGHQIATPVFFSNRIVILSWLGNTLVNSKLIILGVHWRSGAWA